MPNFFAIFFLFIGFHLNCTLFVLLPGPEPLDGVSKLRYSIKFGVHGVIGDEEADQSEPHPGAIGQPAGIVPHRECRLHQPFRFCLADNGPVLGY